LAQEVPIIALLRHVAPFAIVAAVAVLDTPPLLESVLGEDLVAEMPFAEIARGVIGVPEEFRKDGYVLRQGDVVLGAAVHVRPEAGHNGRARGCADRLADVGIAKHHGLGRQTVQIGRLDDAVTIRGHSVRPLFVGPEKKQVGLAPCGLLPLRFLTKR